MGMAMKTNKSKTSTGLFLIATALSSGLISQSAFADECAVPYAQVPQGCEQPNNGTTVRMPAEPNTEWDEGDFDGGAEGFVIAVDGKPVDADPRLEDQIRETDIALARADVQVKFDGLDATPRLDLLVQHTDKSRSAGDQFVVQSRLNYPAFVDRAEIRLIDTDHNGAWRMLGVVPIEPNGAATVRLPEGNKIVAVHRVYDAKGRYDETFAIPLTDRDTRGLVLAVEEGTDATSSRNIPVSGGAITVSSSNVTKGSVVTTLGETITPTSDGRFAIQRIMPAGEYDVDVAITGPMPTQFSREVEIPNAEWFVTGIGDATVGVQTGSGTSGTETYSLGRVAFYAKGKTASGYSITMSLDTKEDELGNLLSGLTKKDPLSLAQRIDPGDVYPIYGDDSTSRDDTPTDGKLYLKVEKQGNYLLWGNYKSRLAGNALLRSERSHYGAQAVWKTQEHTKKGDARAQVELYASKSDTISGRDVFQGTGGSIYFLQRQDVIIRSETISVEVRDPITRQVLSRRVLVAGVDYNLNYFQGVITLTSPLQSTTTEGVVASAGGEANTVNLVAQYEYAPTAASTDGLSAGGRLQAQVTDNLRVGTTVVREDAGVADQDAVAADVLFEFGENSYVRMDAARTSGPGFGAAFSTDGGLIINNDTTTDDQGMSVRAEARVDAKDVGLSFNGTFGTYAERRTAGYSSLDYQVSATTGTENLWGLNGQGDFNEIMSWFAAHDNYSAQNGDYLRKSKIELRFGRNRNVRFDVGADYVESNNGVDIGRRMDVAGRLTFAPDEKREFWVSAQGTASNSGLAKNNRIGVGTRVRFSEKWSGEAEIYDGSNGVGGKALLKFQNEQNDSLYFGYELEAGREMAGTTLRGDDQGRLVMGGKRQVSEKTAVFAENTYDLFGKHRSLTSAYGVDYAISQHMSYSAALELGQINDSIDGDFDRIGFSLGAKYQTEKATGRAKLEFRRERGTTSGNARDADTIVLNSTYRREIDESRRVLLSFQGAQTNTDQSSILDGRVVDASIGYAYRPVDNDKLNVLVKYRYFQDDYGQQIDGTATTGNLQRSHILSADASYDVNEHWTIGGKIGARLSETAADASSPYTSNNAVMAAVNARYHVTHNWDLVAEARVLDSQGAQGTQTSLLIAGYRHFGNNMKVGVGYNFGSFSDDLTDFNDNHRGLFVNVVFKF
jgi:hypothetical protein